MIRLRIPATCRILLFACCALLLGDLSGKASNYLPDEGAGGGMPRLRKVRIVGRGKDPWAVKDKRASLRKGRDDELEKDYQLAVHFRRTGKKDAAYSLLKNLYQLNPNNISLLLLLSEMAVEAQGNRTEATTLLKEAVQLDPQNANALSNFGYALESWYNRPIEAETCYKNALLIQPNNVIVANNLAALLEGDLLNAAYLQQEGVQKDHQEMVSQARGLYEHALRLDPNDVPTLCNYAGLLQKFDNEQSAAASLFARAVAMEPNNVACVLQRPEILLFLVICFLVIGLTNRPYQVFLLINYGSLLSDWGENIQLAKEYYQTAIHLDPTMAEPRAFMAQALRLERNFTYCDRFLRDSLTMCPESKELLGEMELLKDAIKDKQIARERLASETAGGCHPRMTKVEIIRSGNYENLDETD